MREADRAAEGAVKPWIYAEHRAALTLGGERVKRRRGESAPDVRPVRLPNGELLQPECKTRRRLPRLVMAALDQARGYLPGAVPVAIISEKGGEAIACLPLRDLARLLGLQPEIAGQQLTLGRSA